MKKILGLALAVLMVMAMIPTTMAYVESSSECPECFEYICEECGECPVCAGEECDCIPTVNHDQGTQVKYLGQGSAQYTITVPAQLAPGGSGTVTLEGTWASNCQVKVTADTNVVLTNSINSNDQKTLTVSFDGIDKAGDNTKAVLATEEVSVSNISNALFGTWSGTFNYNVEYVDGFDMYDVNCDGVVDSDDVDALRSVYNQTVSNTTNPALFARCDFDNNGIIDSSDLNTLLRQI